ncbi:LysR family transcriptional regulator [Curtanaerobium respiraculi]|uniref:LysR family transcriptional regulator n=1 Tax=Curtanaerobium respiraculi TaxID=2949669 RepID=UPI0024B3BA9F|nr:LysR family transcriptional regulator [Curtanaerobium respiraculi]
MEFRQLECFIAVAEELHFGKAAKRLHIAEPAFGKQIKNLESELGFPLLERTTRSVKLTPAGRAFAEETRKTLRQSEHAADAARQIAADKAGVVRLGYESSAAPAILPTFMKRFRNFYPDIELVTLECSLGGLSKIAEGSIDACLITRSSKLPEGFGYTCILHDTALVALPAYHPLAKREEVSFSELSGTVMLGYKGARENDPSNQFMAEIAARYGFPYRREAESHMALLALVAAGMGFTPATGTMSKLMSGEVAYVRIADPGIIVEHGLALPLTGQAPVAKALKNVALRLARDLA